MTALQSLLNLPNTADAADFRKTAGNVPRSVRPPLPVLASPPTVTLLAANDADVIANGVRIMPRRLQGSKTTLFDVDGDPSFEVVGCPQGQMVVDASDIARPNFLTGGSSQVARWPAAWIFETDASRIDIYTRGLTSSLQYRLWVLDKASGRFLPNTLAFTSVATTAGTRYRLKVDFGTAEPRVVMYQPVDPYFGGVIIPPTATIQRPKRRKQRFGVLSDSTGRGANSANGGATVVETWPMWCAEYLDMDYWNLSIGGSGYIAAPTGLSRLSDIVAAQLDHLVIAFGQNDKATNTVGDVITAAQALLQAVKTSSPKTRVYLGGIHMTTVGLDAKNEPLETALRALAVTENVPFVSLRDPQNLLSSTQAWTATTSYLMGEAVAYNGLVWLCTADHTSTGSFDATKFRPNSFLTGTGRVGATVGDGNADLFVSNDSVHWMVDAHKMQGLWYAEQLLPLMGDRF